MTDRAQPGAIDSLIRNDELAQVFGRFSEGFVVPGNNPTPAAQRRGDIDETALDAFSLTTSTTSLDVTVGPGEAFVSGWVCRDVSTTLTLPANSTIDIVVGFDPDAIFDPQADADRDAADETVVDLAGNVDATTPTTVAHQVSTDGTGVISSERVATVGSSIQVNSVSTTTLEIDGVRDVVSDTRNAVNQLFIDNARQDFELGLNIIDMDDGQFEIYANNNRIADSSNVSLNLGSPLNGKGTVSLASSATNGFTEHIIEDFDFRPNSVVVTDDLETNPQNGTVTYEIEDENANIVTVPRSQLNQRVDVSGTIETYAVSTRAVLERNSTTDTSPVLDAYSVYISGQKPDDYLDATVQTVSEV